jgi:CO dehydrogenase/acetyl-CoA synthase beta subunit
LSPGGFLTNKRTGCVPKLQPDGPVFEIHGLGEEVDADGGLVRVVERVVHEPERSQS